MLPLLYSNQRHDFYFKTPEPVVIFVLKNALLKIYYLFIVLT